MPEYVWYIGFAISLVFALSSSILIGRRIFKTGIEHFSSRILIVSSIINASLCGLLFLLQGITELYRIITSTSFSLDQFIFPAVFLVIPSKIIWNYFAIQRKLVAKFHLKPYGIGAFAASVNSLCKTNNGNLSSDYIVFTFDYFAFRLWPSFRQGDSGNS